ncbi:hypothetical protein Hypma_001805 [Hypsizygus marmoreus]|uniref:MYND-type domain-containing protein n=1 Tax=Hypsizygus marmoreus TaxID=39966 RepID=A0A369JE80_HYPMA|nr:hypothetical protein Hypma_001805 [Hypsizygus marmoreus]
MPKLPPLPPHLKDFHFSGHTAEVVAKAQKEIDLMRASKNQRKAELWENRMICAACGKPNDERKPLQACIRCRTVRYCDKKCQVAHFHSIHREDCKSFRTPPTCRAYDTLANLPGCSYPQDGVFGHVHTGGIGVWISPFGCIDSSLLCIPGHPQPMNMEKQKPTLTYDQWNQFFQPCSDLASLDKYMALLVVVQNRNSKKDAKPIVVVGTSIMAIGSAEGTPALVEGKLPGETHLMTEDHDGKPTVALAPTYVCVSHFNGKSIYDNTHPSVIHKATSTVVLSLGDFVIFEVQYRCGGPRIRRDYQALERLRCLTISTTPRDPTFRGEYRELIPLAARKGQVTQLDAMIDQAAVAEWFADIKTKGVEAHVRSHFGEERVKWMRTGTELALEQAKMSRRTKILADADKLDMGPESMQYILNGPDIW